MQRRAVMEAARFQRAQVAREGEEPSSLFRLHARCTPFFSYLRASSYPQPFQTADAIFSGSWQSHPCARREEARSGWLVASSLSVWRKKKRERGGGVKKNRKREPRGPRSLRPSNWRRCPSTEQKETELSLSLSFFRSVSFFARFSIARNLLIPFFVFFWKTVCVEIDSRCS